MQSTKMSSMKCETCGKENESSAKFCGICGSQLIEDSVNFNPQSIGAENPMVGFTEAISLGFKNYINFRGRATRAEYWWWFLFVFLGGVVTGIIDSFGIESLRAFSTSPHCYPV